MNHHKSITLSNLKASSITLNTQKQKVIYGGERYIEAACSHKGFCISSLGENQGVTTFYIDPALMPYDSGFKVFNDGTVEPLD